MKHCVCLWSNSSELWIRYETAVDINLLAIQRRDKWQVESGLGEEQIKSSSDKTVIRLSVFADILEKESCRWKKLYFPETEIFLKMSIQGRSVHRLQF